MRRLLALPVVLVAALLAVGAANAGKGQVTLTCAGLGTISVTTTMTKNDNSVGWGIGKVSSSLHAIPVSFSDTVTDLTTNTVLDSFNQAKGGGDGMHNQSAVTCDAPPETATAGEAGIPGVNPSDIVQFDFSAQVALKP